MPEALVNPEVLRWARERAALPIDVLAEKLKTSAETVVAWEDGAARPTFKQAEKFAAHVHIPFGYLFLPEPPEENLPIPDLRTQADSARGQFSADFLDLIRDVMFQHDWFRDHLVERGAEPLPFVGRFSENTPPESVAADIRKVLGIGTDGGADEMATLSEKCEQVGIWVMKAGYVGSNTHRTLSVSDFRGFAVVDEIAPLIVINGRDAKPAQVFTLAHELAHIWLGKSGISDPYLDRSVEADRDIERLCNAIAAEALVPRALFLKLWQTRQSLSDNAKTLAAHFGVSQVVIARRALDLGKIGWDAHHAFFEQQRQKWERTPTPDGGNFYANAPVKFGKRFTRAVVSSAMSGNLLLRDASSLLHMKPATVKKLFDRL